MEANFVIWSKSLIFTIFENRISPPGVVYESDCYLFETFFVIFRIFLWFFLSYLFWRGPVVCFWRNILVSRTSGNWICVFVRVLSIWSYIISTFFLSSRNFQCHFLIGGSSAESRPDLTLIVFCPFWDFEAANLEKNLPGFEGRKNLRYCRGLRIQTKHFHFLYSNPEISANSTNFHYKPSLTTEKGF